MPTTIEINEQGYESGPFSYSLEPSEILVFNNKWRFTYIEENRMNVYEIKNDKELVWNHSVFPGTPGEIITIIRYSEAEDGLFNYIGGQGIEIKSPQEIISSSQEEKELSLLEILI